MHISNYRVRRADCSLLEYVGIEPKYSWQPIRLECNWNKSLSVTIKSAQRTTHSIVTFIRSNWNTFTKETLRFCWYTPSTDRTTKTKHSFREKKRTDFKVYTIQAIKERIYLFYFYRLFDKSVHSYARHAYSCSIKTYQMQSVQDTRKTDERRRFNTNEMQEQKKR